MAPPMGAPTPSKRITRTTRSQAAKVDDSYQLPPQIMPISSSGGKAGLFSRSKESFRKVSDKLKDKDQGVQHSESRALPSASSYPRSVASLEALKAYLRIRPCPADGSAQAPYLEVQNEREVLMRSNLDARSIKPAHVYSFDHVFPPSSSTQSSFFSQTTLPLVDKLLQGENGLVFAYGVTNSGKTYTITGADAEGEQGLLPRAVDVVFNSIDGAQSKANVSCVGPADIKIAPGRPAPLNMPVPAFVPSTNERVKVDKNYSYAIFVSCAEVYNDKIYDLLESVMAAPGVPPSTSAKRQQSMLASSRTSSAFAVSSLLASTSNGRITRKQLQLKKDLDGNGKYIGGLHEVRVQSQAEALALLQAGQCARQVFSTQSNRESSRSHGIFTIKVVRIHNGAPNDPDSALVSRLSIVDLAGSERNKNTGTQGAQLKEAGQINQSLMVLGQCFQTLRSNQQKLASAAAGKRAKQDLVPFRHSRLTEIFQSFFVGDGRAVMIVNINPYDTGYEENTHVMRFSAIARDVQTTAGNKGPGHGSLRRQISTQFNQLKNAFQAPGKLRLTVPEAPTVPTRFTTGALSKSAFEPKPPANPSNNGGPMPKGRTASDEWSLVEKEVEIEVIDEDEGDDDDSESNGGRDVLVDTLFEELREARQQLFEAELRNSTIEMEIRAQVAQEMLDQLDAQNAEHKRQLDAVYRAAEDKANSKLDIMAKFAPSRYCEACEADLSTSRIGDEDITMDETPDQSFVSALEGSRRVSQGDPFVVRTGAERVVRGSSHAGDASFTSSHLTSPSSRQIGRLNVPRLERESTAESDDVLSRSMRQDDAQEGDVEDEGEDSEREATAAVKGKRVVHQDESESEEEEEIGGSSREEDGGEDDDDDTEIDADEEEVLSGNQADQDSSFASEMTPSITSSSDASFEQQSSSEDDEETRPVRRGTVTRRKTGSPQKRSSPIKGTPGNGSAKVAKVSPKSRATPKVKPGSARGKQVGKAVTRTPLTERLEQEAEEEESLQNTKPKKKRALGRKIVLEDDMPDPSTPISGAEVRRLNRAGKV